MDEFAGAIPVSNSMTLCVGAITNLEAQHAREAGLEVDGTGYYLFMASHDDLKKPIAILAKFLSPSGAERLARLIGD